MTKFVKEWREKAGMSHHLAVCPSSGHGKIEWIWEKRQ